MTASFVQRHRVREGVSATSREATIPLWTDQGNIWAFQEWLATGGQPVKKETLHGGGGMQVMLQPL